MAIEKVSPQTAERFNRVTEIKVSLPLFLATRLKMASTQMQGQILDENEQAIHFEGRPAQRPSAACLRCGRKIQDDESRQRGYGPECWPKIEQASVWKGWLPRSKVTIEGDEAEQPAPAQRVDSKGIPDLTFTPRIYVKDDRIHFKVPFAMNAVVRERTSPRFNSDELSWSYEATPDAATTLMEAFYEVKPEMDARFEELLQRAQRVKKAQAIKTATDLPPIPNTKYQPWQHQAQAFWFAMEVLGAKPSAKD